MRQKLLISLVLLTIVSLFITTPALADGIIIPDDPIICKNPPCSPIPKPMAQLTIKYHHVEVTIKDQVAVTHVDQVFYNPNDWSIEGTYIFPLPLDAAVSGFTLWVDGMAVEGKILGAEEARQTYEKIVRDLRDPALLEYSGRGAVQARIFPIPPGGERRVELEYSQVLTAENGLVRYVYPLNTEKFSALPLESVSVSVDVTAPQSIRAVYSPTHTISTDRLDTDHIRTGYEAKDIIPDTDFALYYSLGESEAFHVLSYRDPADPAGEDGFFLLLLAPRPEVKAKPVPKDILLVLDHSGSMDGEKIQQAKKALQYVLEHLNPDDRFNVIAFSTGIQTYASRLRSSTDAREAIAWVDRISAEGSTDINRALLEAAAMTEGERPTYLIFLTDGLPTDGEIGTDKILNNFAQSAPDNLRLFAFGVGYDVDTQLLDTLAQEQHGATTYVHPEENIDEVLSGFYAKISTPVLTDLRLDFGDLATYGIYPDPLPDLFVGSQIVVVGRYRKGGVNTVNLSGEVNGKRQTFRYPEQEFVTDSRSLHDSQPALPRLWATRKIGYLLNKIRLRGSDAETVDQIVKLSIRYGIVTPYTSYLVTEPMPLGVEEQERIAQDQYNEMLVMPTAMPMGQGAVQQAEGERKIAGAEAPSAPPVEARDIVRVVGSRTFVYSDGVWVDTGFDPQTMQTIKVAFLSDDYFKLTKAVPELSPAFALGENVIVLANGNAYEVVNSDAPTRPINISPTSTPTTDEPETELSSVTPSDRDQPVQSKNDKPVGTTCLGGLLPLVLMFFLLRYR
jgi:Ca-activated chloride channel family protein